MCEFCIQHGEGKQWYLQMKNYSNELLHTPLTPQQSAAAGFNTRQEWLDDDFEATIIPAYGGKIPASTPISEVATQKPAQPLTAEQILAWRKLVHFGQVLPIEDVEKVITMADSITRLPCACRYFNRGLKNQRYCFGLGIDRDHVLGKYPDSAANLEVIDRQEALKLVHRFDEEGLMHSVWSGVIPYISGLCNCDGDCSAYRDYIKDRGIPNFFRAEYICQVDIDQCNGCRECMSQCQFGAQFYSSSMGKVSIAPELCFGCGVCRAACPQGAISLVPRAEVPEVADIF
jgi:ferredoxin